MLRARGHVEFGSPRGDVRSLAKPMDVPEPVERVRTTLLCSGIAAF